MVRVGVLYYAKAMMCKWWQVLNSEDTRQRSNEAWKFSGAVLAIVIEILFIPISQIHCRTRKEAGRM